MSNETCSAAGAAGELRAYSFTFGVYTQTTWTDVRSLSWLELTNLLTTHEVGAKAGTCIVPAVFRGTRRHKSDADRIDVAFLDSDSGATLDEIVAAVNRRGWAAIISSTHSHLSTTTRVKRSAWERFLQRHPDPGTAAARFLEAKHFLPRIAVGAEILEVGNELVTIHHQPCPKFRIAIPLLQPWQSQNYENQNQANDVWKERVEALAAALHLNHDQSCTDTSRLFYLPRRAADSPPPDSVILDGEFCDLFGLPLAVADHAGQRHSAPSADMSNIRNYIDPETGEIVDLIAWARQYGARFQLATALRARSSVRVLGSVSGTRKQLIVCANGDEHTDPAIDAATFVMDAADSNNHGFVYHCRHAHCDGHDRLYFMYRMLDQQWLNISDLTDPAFLCQRDEREEPEPKPSFEDCCAAADALTQESSPDGVTAVLRLVAAAGLDAIRLRHVLCIVKSRTDVPLSSLKAGLSSLKTGLEEAQKAGRGTCADIGLAVARAALSHFWGDGKHLIRAVDKSFWEYIGSHWIRRTDEQVKNRLLKVVEELVNPSDRDFNSALNASFNLLVATCAVSTDLLRLTEEPPPVINCANGELWISDDGSVELRPHRYDNYLTYVLNVGFEPRATCVEFDRTILQIFANSSDPEAMVRHHLEFMGYAIQPRRNIASYFMLKGAGNNGKTKLVETLERLINARCMFSGRLSEIEGNKFLIGSLAGKLILLDDDIDTGIKIPDGLLKKLSERKLLTGELKFKDSFEFIATCLPVLLANNFPLCADLSYGQRRRAKIIPFDRVFLPEEDDRGLFPRIWQHELPGILNRAIEGLRRLRHRGAFDEPVDCIRAKQEWLAHANPLVAFIDERCLVAPCEQIPLTPLYRSFTSWATDAGIRNIPARNTLKANLINLGFAVRRTAEHSSVVFGLTTAFGLTTVGPSFPAWPVPGQAQ